MPTIIVEPKDVWRFFLQNREVLREKLRTIAENLTDGIEIYVTEEGNLPQILVFEDDEEIFAEIAQDPDDCVDTVQYVYDVYLDPTPYISAADDDDDDDKPGFSGFADFEYDDGDIDNVMQAREDDLSDAVYVMLDTVLENSDRGFPDIEEYIEPVKDLVCEYLARQCGLDIWRPMILEDENGAEFYEEYPYECIVFDDEKGA